MDNFNLDSEKDDFSTKNDNFPSLTYLCARMVYYINLNCIYK